MNDEENNKSLDQYFSAIMRSTQSIESLSKYQEELQEATFIAVESTLDLAETFVDVRKKALDSSSRMAESISDSDDQYRKYKELVGEQLSKQQVIVDYFGKLTENEKEKLKDSNDTTDSEEGIKDEKEQQHKDEKEHTKEKQGLLKRVRNNLEENAKSGGGYTKTYGSRAILAASDGIKSLFSGIAQQIPMFNEVKAGVSKVRSIGSDINQTRIRRKQAKEDKKIKKPSESGVDKRKNEADRKERKRNTRLQGRMLKAQKEGNNLLEKMNRRMMFQSLFSMFGGLVKNLGSMISSGVGMAFKGLGLVSALKGLTGIMGMLKGAVGGLGKMLGMGKPKGAPTPKGKPNPKVRPTTASGGKQPMMDKGETAKKAKTVKARAGKMGNVAKGIAKTGSKLGRVALGGAKFAGKMALRAVPGLGWGLLAYDAINLATGGAADEMVGKAVDKAGELIGDAVDSISSWFSDDDEEEEKKKDTPEVKPKNRNREVLENRLEHFTEKYEEAVAAGDDKGARLAARGMSHYKNRLDNLDSESSKLSSDDRPSSNGKMLEHYTNKYEQAREEKNTRQSEIYQKAIMMNQGRAPSSSNVTQVNNTKSVRMYTDSPMYSSGSKYQDIQR